MENLFDRPDGVDVIDGQRSQAPKALESAIMRLFSAVERLELVANHAQSTDANLERAREEIAALKARQGQVAIQLDKAINRLRCALSSGDA